MHACVCEDCQHVQAEVPVRAAVILMDAHQARLMAAPACRPLLAQLQRSLRSCVQSMKNVTGFNLAGLHHVQDLAKARVSAPTAVAVKRVAKRSRSPSVARP